MDLDELRTLLARHARPDGSTAIGGVLISKVDQPGDPSPATSGTVLALIAQGAKRLALGERVYEYSAGQYLVASVDLPVTGHFIQATPQRPALGFGLILRPSTVAELLLQAPASDVPHTGGRALPGIAVGDASHELLDAVIRLLRLLDRPRDIAVLAPLLEREILWWLLTGDQGAIVGQIGLPDSNLAHIARAVQWIRGHYTQSFRVDELARLSAMSVSAFYRNFHTVTAMSPIQFQKQIRLQQARLLLAIHSNDITAVGHRVGYDSPSQFSREYRRQFGVPPSHDAARLRGPVHASALPLP
ncbi:MAG: AraC family transcriptional regulator [Pseudonocardia sp.]|nr:AraC family transcriptional regulator [Pseudonocardia sp.]